MGLRVTAAVSPVYSGSYFDTFQDKYDFLLSLSGKRKIVLSSGSSGRYGYDSTLLKEAFPGYEPVNMGVYAYSNALPQLALILGCVEEGDLQQRLQHALGAAAPEGGRLAGGGSGRRAALRR